MWSYYGRKSKVVSSYPPPVFDTIIEPFAGTATYALYNGNWKKRVILIEKYEVIVGIWNYLQHTTPERIRQLPDAGPGDNVRDLSGLCQEEMDLISFCTHRGTESPRNRTGKFNNWSTDRSYIASDLYKIKHWKIVLGDYHCIDNIEATWFIDPPYQFGGEHYIENSVRSNFSELAKWSISRRGQVIVCENTKADWLNFQPLKQMTGNRHTTTEAIWTNGVGISQAVLL